MTINYHFGFCKTASDILGALSNFNVLNIVFPRTTMYLQYKSAICLYSMLAFFHRFEASDNRQNSNNYET